MGAKAYPQASSTLTPTSLLSLSELHCLGVHGYFEVLVHHSEGSGVKASITHATAESPSHVMQTLNSQGSRIRQCFVVIALPMMENRSMKKINVNIEQHENCSKLLSFHWHAVASPAYATVEGRAPRLARSSMQVSS